MTQLRQKYEIGDKTMGHFRLPGPVCAVLKDTEVIDAGTLCRRKTHPPGIFRASVADIEAKKSLYLGYARGVSYVMQGQSVAHSSLNWIDETLHDIGITDEKKPRRVQSVLGGAFLRMYLDGKVDSKIVEQAGEEIAASKAFEKLQEKLNKRIQNIVNKSPRKELTEKQIVSRSKRYLNWKRKRKKYGIEFRYTLNAVIGGVTGIDVSSAKLLSKSQVSNRVEIEYQVDVTFIDTYDFENKRYGAYDRYRKKLSRFLQANKFEQFEKTYLPETLPYDKWHRTKFDNASLFASFMYALEKKGWTPGPLSWQVTVPMKITIIYKVGKRQRGK